MLSELPLLYRFTALLNSGGSNSPSCEFWSEFPHFMGMGVVPAPSTICSNNLCFIEPDLCGCSHVIRWGVTSIGN